MAYIVSMEELNDVVESWNEGAILNLTVGDVKKICFENLTLVPIEKDLINFNLLTKLEKNYLFKYHLDVYSKISKFLNLKEKKWLASFI